ncbi:MAG TPA: hypothetical protein VFB38_00415 [Chthonomonadaceae bacterium]|nr:hypothetical protein [Chthonomonadaceae bacterium]
MKSQRINPECARKRIGRGGVFVITYCDHEGIEQTRAFHVYKVEERHGCCYLTCEDGWLPLQSVRCLRAWREPNTAPVIAEPQQASVGSPDPGGRNYDS